MLIIKVNLLDSTVIKEYKNILLRISLLLLFAWYCSVYDICEFSLFSLSNFFLRLFLNQKSWFSGKQLESKVSKLCYPSWLLKLKNVIFTFSIKNIYLFLGRANETKIVVIHLQLHLVLLLVALMEKLQNHYWTKLKQVCLNGVVEK